MLPLATGARLGTVTWKLCDAAKPPESRAVTVIVVAPTPLPWIVSTLPDTLAHTTSVSVTPWAGK